MAQRFDAPWGNWQPKGFWFPRFWFESRRGSAHDWVPAAPGERGSWVAAPGERGSWVPAAPGERGSWVPAAPGERGSKGDRWLTEME